MYCNILLILDLNTLINIDSLVKHSSHQQQGRALCIDAKKETR